MTNGCDKSALGASGNCGVHGGGWRCIQANCEKAARDAVSGKCVAHGGGLRCPNCVSWPDSRTGNARYDGYCATCFKRVFPSDPRSAVIYSHAKEIRVRNMINIHFDGFIHDKPLHLGCDCAHYRRVDHRCLIEGTMLAIETDEFGHRRYEERDEEIRYDDLMMVFTGKWIFIRFNPDGDKLVDMEDKLERLRDEISHQIERIELEENKDLLEIVKLYY